jgi:S-adenosylmethionine:diacylglycerol 3-amino-3-carboxypropyl transferase
MPIPPFVSDIFYSVQNEDVASELAVVEQIGRSEQRVLLIASGGENVLGLLCQPEIAHVDAVDLSLAQIQLCRLRCAAAQQLSRDEQLALLGCDPTRAGPVGVTDRWALYDRLRPTLPTEACDFWDARRTEEIAFGVHHVGRNDCLMQDLVAALAEVGIAPLQDNPASIDATRWLDAYTQVLTPAHLQRCFGFPNPAVAARLAALSPHLAAQHLRALRQPEAGRNPYVTTVFGGGYATTAGEVGLPRYLQHDGQVALRRLGIDTRLALHHGNLLTLMPQLAAQGGHYDLISLSNIADWMDEAQVRELVEASRTCLRPGGGLLLRAANPEAPIRSAVAAALASHPALDAVLPVIERGPWFRTLVVGFRHGSP